MHLSAGMIPPGKRLATPQEADLIAGRLTEADYLATAPSLATASPPTTRGQKKQRKGRTRKPPRIVIKFGEQKAFFASLADRTPPLSPGAIVIWLWLHHCERDQVAIASHAKLQHRFQLSRSSVKRYLDELTAAGLIQVERLGRLGAGASTYRVYPPTQKSNHQGET